MRKMGLKTLDIYIIKKFLGTYIFAISVVLAIAVIFDFSEKIDDFMNSNAPWRAIIFDYYFNFIPYFALLFSPMFTFIAVIYFTSKMATNTEIIAMLSNGISFNRILVPYFISAMLIGVFSFLLNNYVIPNANEERFAFEEVYYHKVPVRFRTDNLHKQIRPGVFIYFDTYRVHTKTGFNFSIEKFENKKLKSKLFAKRIQWDDNLNKWRLEDYYIRDYIDSKEILTFGTGIDTSIYILPEHFVQRDNIIEAMSLDELNDYIDVQLLQGSTNINLLYIEKHKRIAMPFSAFILTLIGVSVSSRKSRGGIGGHIGFGLAVVFGYIVFIQFSSQFAIKGSLSPFLASWMPNFLFALVAIYLYKISPK